MGKNLYVGCRVRIIYSNTWPFLRGKEGTIVSKLPSGTYSLTVPDKLLEWEVSVDDWGSSKTPQGINPFGWFCPGSDQLEPIVPPGLESGEEINKLYEPEFIPVEEYAKVRGLQNAQMFGYLSVFSFGRMYRLED